MAGKREKLTKKKKKLIVKKILNARQKKFLRMFWIRSTDDRLVTNKNNKRNTINKVRVGTGGMPTAGLTDGRGRQQRGQCFALSKSNGADEGPVSAHCHGLSDEWGWKCRMVWVDQPYDILI